jgi:hypothetical protein
MSFPFGRVRRDGWPGDLPPVPTARNPTWRTGAFRPWNGARGGEGMSARPSASSGRAAAGGYRAAAIAAFTSGTPMKTETFRAAAEPT